MKNVMRALAVTMVAAALPIAAACDRQPDVKDQVVQRLEAANLSHVDVDWDNDARIAHLKGQVNSPDERHRAEQVATEAVGTSGTVLNELTVEGLNENTADDMDGQIRDRLSEMVDRDPALKERNIDFDVNNGTVSVTGTVASEAEKQRVTELVQSAPGVTDFANRLEIEGQQPTAQ
jgi:osmotically-inducible protein OsmY